jgi:hypothetical protein
MKIPAIAVKFDKISLEAAAAIRANGGQIVPVEHQPGRYYFIPPSRCRWGGPLHFQSLRLPDGAVIRCRPHDQTVELLTDAEYRAGK